MDPEQEIPGTLQGSALPHFVCANEGKRGTTMALSRSDGMPVWYLLRGRGHLIRHPEVAMVRPL
jgi:hypothetical protein